MIRIKRIIEETIKELKLNLEGLTVYTEAASGHYIFTPIIAALAGSHVIAFSKDSIYGKVKEIKRELLELAEEFNIVDKISIVTPKKKEDISKADIITNSGLLRPIDKGFIEMMKPSAVIALMYEPWELRKEDIDVFTCWKKGIKIVGINEEHPLVDVFSYVGILGIKMVLEAGIEIHKSRIAILSADKFGLTLRRYLKNCGAQVLLSDNLSQLLRKGIFDAVIYANYTSRLFFSAKAIAILKKDETKIIQFLGGLNYKSIKNAGLFIYPDRAFPIQKMVRTFADLGPKPVIELQAAGLKSAEIICHGEKYTKRNSFCNFAQEIRE